MALKFKKVSADEVMSKRKDHMKDTPKGSAVLKAAKSIPSWDEETRTARFVMTTQQVDRYGDIVVTEGGDITEFERNPVAPLCHNTRAWPIGTWSNLESILKGRPPRMEGDMTLLPSGGPVKEIDEAAWMISNKAVRAVSIGFVPDWDNVEIITDDDGYWKGFRFNAWELIECSLCVVPANPGALAKMAQGDMRLAKELLEETLDGWRKTPDGLIIPRETFESEYRLVVEKIGTTATPKLPVTDEEKAEAEIRSVEFEVGRLLIPAEGMRCCVEGDEVDMELVVQNGTWKHFGTVTHKGLPHKAVAHAVVECSVENDRRIYKVVKQCPPIGKEWSLGDEGWMLVDIESEAKNARAEAPAPKQSVISLELDTTQAEAGIGRLSSMLEGLQSRFAKMFGAQEPAKNDKPAEEPEVKDTVVEPEVAAAAKTRAGETLARLKEAGRI